MRITITQEEKSKVWEFLKNNNIGKRGDFDGKKEHQYVGLLGEMKVHQLFKKDFEFKNDFDGGYDMMLGDKKVDIKTMGRNVNMQPDYVHNFSGLQKHFQCDIYIFASLNKKTSDVTVCGWVTKEELFERAEKFKKGTKRQRSNGTNVIFDCTTYEIKNKDLNDISLLL